MAPDRSPRRHRLLVCALALAATAASLLDGACARAAGPYPDGVRGNDISFPQCGSSYPPPGTAIAIVGLEHGHPFSVNPCLDAEWAWAMSSPNPPSVYINLNYSTHFDPGMPESMSGPAGSCAPADGLCRGYNWGWNNAAYAVDVARRRGMSPAAWWFDAETGDWWDTCNANNTACDTAVNARVAQGSAEYMSSQGLPSGFYSTTYQWGLLMGGYRPPGASWVPDYDDSNPLGFCTPVKGFTAGQVSIVQYTDAAFDGDFSCPAHHGYWLIAGDGGVFPFGTATGFGSTGGMRLNAPIVGMAGAGRGSGYWLVASDGGIFPFGPGATGYGSTGGIRLNQPVVAMAAAPDGHGYWLVASDGGIFPFGPSAGGYGSTGNVRLNQPIVGIAVTPSGRGYWLVASDGGIFPFGDAVGYGSTGNVRLNRPIVSMASTADGRGYWLVASDGGIFPFGDAVGYGSAAGTLLDAPVVAMARTVSGHGYYLLTGGGSVLTYGDAVNENDGQWAPRALNAPMLALATVP